MKCVCGSEVFSGSGMSGTFRINIDKQKKVQLRCIKIVHIGYISCVSCHMIYKIDSERHLIITKDMVESTCKACGGNNIGCTECMFMSYRNKYKMWRIEDAGKY